MVTRDAGSRLLATGELARLARLLMDQCYPVWAHGLAEAVGAMSAQTGTRLALDERIDLVEQLLGALRGAAVSGNRLVVEGGVVRSDDASWGETPEERFRRLVEEWNLLARTMGSDTARSAYGALEQAWTRLAELADAEQSELLAAEHARQQSRTEQFVAQHLVPNGQQATSGLGLGDRLFVVAHHPHTGAPHLAGRVVGLGLAAAALVDLVVAGCVVLDPAGVVRVVADVPAPDVLPTVSAGVLDELRAHPATPVEQWLPYLAQDIAAVPQRPARAAMFTLVRRDLARRWIVRTASSGGWRRAALSRPIEPRLASMIISLAVRGPGELDAFTAVLLGLITAIGLDQVLRVDWPALTALPPPSAAAPTGEHAAQIELLLEKTSLSVTAAVVARRM